MQQRETSSANLSVVEPEEQFTTLEAIVTLAIAAYNYQIRLLDSTQNALFRRSDPTARTISISLC